ncbi:MAG: hypothetical protein Q9186_005715 [Xanthomendoza sp. 1 TL-2023]
MLSVLLSGFVALGFTALPVAATQFCQCEHVNRPAWKFPGIQAICHPLSQDWCSTNCNALGRNCDYCQFKPAGQGPEDDYRRLTSWCSQQQAYDREDDVYVHGTDVICYSYKNRLPMKFGYTGCEHENNGDDFRDKTAYLASKLEGGWYQRRGCSNLQTFDWTTMAKNFIKQNPTCNITTTGNEFTRLLTCPYSDDKQRVNQLQTFKDNCEAQKGNWYLRDNGPGPLSLPAHSEDDASQRTLGMPGRYPPKLTSSRKQHDCDSKVDAQDGPLKSKGDDDMMNKVHEEGRGGTRRVVFEENGMRVIVVDDEL